MLGSILGAVGSIAGGLLGNKAADKANKMNLHAMKNQLQWKAEDAEKAGISKIFAMGAPVQSFSSNVGNFDFLGNAGQNIGRAMETGQSNPQTNLSRTAQAIQIEGMQLDNDVKRAQLSSILRTQSQPATPPGIPAPNTVDFIPGQGAGQTESGALKVETKIDTANPADPSATPGNTPEVMLTRTNTGGYSVALPPALQEAYESMGIIPTYQWNYRNIARPALDSSSRPADLVNLAKRTNQVLTYNPLTGEYHLKPKPSFKYHPDGRLKLRY